MAFSFKYTRLSAFAQILLGGLCIIFGIADRAKIFKRYWEYGDGSYDYAFHTQSVAPIWTGVWIVVTGAIGIAGSRRIPNTDKPSGILIGTYLGFSVVSIVFAGVVLIMYSIGIAAVILAEDKANCSQMIVYLKSGQSYYPYGQTTTVSPTINMISECKTSVGLGAMIIIFAALEFGVGIWACVCCCSGGCHCCQPSGYQSPPQMGDLFFVQTQHGPASYVMTQGANGAPIAVPATSSVAMTTGQAGQIPMQAPNQQVMVHSSPSPQVVFSSPPTGAGTWTGTDARAGGQQHYNQPQAYPV